MSGKIPKQLKMSMKVEKNEEKGELSSTSDRSSSTCVKVALRIRPFLQREMTANAKECVNLSPSKEQVLMGRTHAFSYDYVFATDASQDDIFVGVGKPLIDGLLQGYNATVLAYGQTGSGKTFTMGIGFDPNVLTTQSEAQGLLPRCIAYLFDSMQNGTESQSLSPHFKVGVQFTELYNDEVVDLLSDTTSTRRPQVKIHETREGQINLVNVNTRSVSSAQETLETLKNGALNRTTASTNMNDQSSRSHAIFTIHVTQNRVTRDKNGAADIETLSGKFHFVDLAGSERLKRTLATGERAREGIAINSGLLELGNVISALNNQSKKRVHVPYRNSKLTRLLQDSLGGNSRTIMIACVSPSDLDSAETLNTMKYAERAKNIKNRVTVNQDTCSRTVSLLKAENARLNLELMEYKRRETQTEKDWDVNAENIMLLSEVDTLKGELQRQQVTIDKLTSQLASLTLSVVEEESAEASKKGPEMKAPETRVPDSGKIEQADASLGTSEKVVSPEKRAEKPGTRKPKPEGEGLQLTRVHVPTSETQETEKKREVNPDKVPKEGEAPETEVKPEEIDKPGDRSEASQEKQATVQPEPERNDAGMKEKADASLGTVMKVVSPEKRPGAQKPKPEDEEIGLAPETGPSIQVETESSQSKLVDYDKAEHTDHCVNGEGSAQHPAFSDANDNEPKSRTAVSKHPKKPAKPRVRLPGLKKATPETFIECGTDRQKEIAESEPVVTRASLIKDQEKFKLAQRDAKKKAAQGVSLAENTRVKDGFSALIFPYPCLTFEPPVNQDGMTDKEFEKLEKKVELRVGVRNYFSYLFDAIVQGLEENGPDLSPKSFVEGFKIVWAKLTSDAVGDIAIATLIASLGRLYRDHAEFQKFNDTYMDRYVHTKRYKDTEDAALGKLLDENVDSVTMKEKKWIGQNCGLCKTPCAHLNRHIIEKHIMGRPILQCFEHPDLKPSMLEAWEVRNHLYKVHGMSSTESEEAITRENARQWIVQDEYVDKDIIRRALQQQL